jgi:uncharacterized protein YbdZ (MbtH family)
MEEPAMQTSSLLVRVITNQAGCFALWTINQQTPPGWQDSGKSGTTEECLTFIDARSTVVPQHIKPLLNKNMNSKSA